MNGLELRRVRLIEASVQALEASPNPLRSQVGLEESYSYRPEEDGFEAVGQFRLVVVDQDSQAEQGSIEVSFGFWYSSKLQPESEGFAGYFEVFKEINLPINMWPFVREFIYNTTARMDWPPFTLPLRKQAPESHRKAPSKTRSK
ncbi:hypothetical protein [Meiothermus sp.]|uniref:hypothetical protein n=1 Tax=Meiothermus sp. TaxID=1955249 RepID=UPI00262B58FC|nr:hypothetical protein [Meiothermus sp.]